MKKMLKLMGFLLFILFFKNSFSQELLPMRKVTLELEIKKMIEFKIPENSLHIIKINEIKQNPPQADFVVSDSYIRTQFVIRRSYPKSPFILFVSSSRVKLAFIIYSFTPRS